MTAAEQQYEFVVCWENPDQERLLEDIQAFWRSERALPEDQITPERASQVVAIALDAERAVVAVSSAFRQNSSLLRLWVWEVRAYVGARHRRSSLARNIMVVVRDYLANRNARKMPPDCSGIFTRVENAGIQSGGIHARTRAGHFNYIGVDDRGNIMQVYWFDDAQTPTQ